MIIHSKRIVPLLGALILLLGACQKPDQPQPAPASTPTPSSTPTPTLQQQIEVPTTSQSIFSNGISFDSGENTSSSGSGSGSDPGSGGASGSGSGEGGSGSQGGGSSEPQPQTQTVNFTAPAAWTATVAETKADETKAETKAASWLTVEPSSGAAGDVTMTVTAQPNDTYEDRAASVTIKSGSASSSFTVKQAGKPRPVEVTEVKLDKTEQELVEGDTETITATVSPDNASNKTVTWTSSDPAVATVDNGKVTAVKAGEATITAKAGEKTAECKVTVKAKDIPAPTPTPTPDPGTGSDVGSGGDSGAGQGGGDSGAGSGGDSGTGGNSDASQGSDSGAGGDSGPGSNPDPGTTPQPPATIVATSVTLDNTTLELTEGDEFSLTARVEPENATDKTVTWSSSDPAVATVVNGKVTAVKAGTATITAKVGEKSADCRVSVSSKAPPVNNFAGTKWGVIDGTVTWTFTFADNEVVFDYLNTASETPTKEQYKASYTYTETTISFTLRVWSNIEFILNGMLSGNSLVFDDSGIQNYDFTMNPYVDVTSLSLDQNTIEIKVGDSKTLHATVGPNTATNKTVTWSTSDEKVATVDANGEVTGFSPGNAVISASSGSVNATCSVNVAEVPVSSIVISESFVTLQIGEEVFLTATVSPDNATNKTVFWFSSDEQVATVDQQGKVTAIRTGGTMIYAKAGNSQTICRILVPVEIGGREGIGYEEY